MKPKRGLSPTFMNALKNNGGPCLLPILKAVQEDDTLCLEIRENYINIYYRGGNLMRIQETLERYFASFDRNYVLFPETSRLPTAISRQELVNSQTVAYWVDHIPLMKHEMDRWFHLHPKEEREFQQFIVRENNHGGAAKGTDYFICDIEYANDCGRFDLVAVEWPSTSKARKRNTGLKLALIEMKYLDKALANTAGLYAHLCDMQRYYKNLQSGNFFDEFRQEMQTVFNQKHELGLIDNQKPIVSFSEELPDFILILANHDPASRILFEELKKVQQITNELPFQLKIAVSNFMGYGLYQQNILDLDTLFARFSDQVYASKKM